MKPDTNHTMDDLLVKYMLGEATPAEQQQVLEWIAQTDENHLYYHQLLAVWEKAAIIEAKSTISEHDAWQRFQTKVQSANTLAPVIPMARRAKYTNWIAAAVILLMAAGAWMLYDTFNNASTIITAGNNVRVDTLPDGSVITLNKNASLTLQKSFNTSIRQVALEGEAFFNVTTDKSRPFIIATGDNIGITVLGTSFNVKNEAATTEIIVESGMVEVRYKQQTIRLSQNEKVTITKNGLKLNKQVNKSELYNHYRTHSFVCHETPLYELVAKLNEVYNADIVIANRNIANQQLTTTFQDASLNHIISIIAKTLNLSVRKEQNRIILE